MYVCQRPNPSPCAHTCSLLGKRAPFGGGGSPPALLLAGGCWLSWQLHVLPQGLQGMRFFLKQCSVLRVLWQQPGSALENDAGAQR